MKRVKAIRNKSTTKDEVTNSRAKEENTTKNRVKISLASGKV